MRNDRRLFALSLALALALAGLFSPASTFAQDVKPRHAIAMHGEPKYGPDFRNFDYVNPNAPKGGEVKLAAIGTFDNLNQFILKGVGAAGLGLVFDTLLTSSADEAFTEYGLLAQSVEMPDDRSWVIFNLRPEARFHDGKPVTADDVIFTFEMLKTKGHPFYRSYYADVAKAEKLGERRVKFSFSGGENRELPLIIGQMPVLPKHFWATRNFEETTLEPPLGSGRYKVDSFEAGRTISYRRVPDYWGDKVPAAVGINNFDVIRYDYYRDTTIALEAFKAGQIDFRQENSARFWATAYDFPAVKDGRVKKESVTDKSGGGMQGFIFNTRRPVFKDRKTREALIYGLDFEWSNKTLFFDSYTRSESYFANSELAATGLPSPAEIKILEPFRGKVPEEVFTKEYKAPKTDGSGTPRENLGIATRLLREAGWTVKDRQLVDSSGKPMAFEILLADPNFERVALPYVQNIERLGAKPTVRVVDASQYQKRVESFDFDMIVGSFGQSLSPGNEQRDYWHSSVADIEGSRNVIGIKDEVVDKLVDLIIAAPDRQALIDRSKALDRVLLWGHYVVPQWHIAADRIAYWDRFGIPTPPKDRGAFFGSWWLDAKKDEALKGRRGN